MTDPFFVLRETARSALGGSLERWACQCHAASLALVKAPLMPEGRVVRGWCDHVFGQHSWMVVGMNCYDPDALIIDPTLWSYDDVVEDIWVGRMGDRPEHMPHHNWTFWDHKPKRGPGEDIPLERYDSLGRAARMYMDLILPLDYKGWCNFATHVGALGWPVGQVVEAMYAQKNLRGALPIDLIGMTTEINPHGLYLRGEADVPARV